MYRFVVKCDVTVLRNQKNVINEIFLTSVNCSTGVPYMFSSYSYPVLISMFDMIDLKDDVIVDLYFSSHESKRFIDKLAHHTYLPARYVNILAIDYYGHIIQNSS